MVLRRAHTGEVRQWQITNSVVASLYRLDTRRVKSFGSPKNSKFRTSYLLSMEGNIPLKSKEHKTTYFLWECASSTQRLKWVIALAQEQSALNLSCSGLIILRNSM